MDLIKVVEEAFATPEKKFDAKLAISFELSMSDTAEILAVESTSKCKITK